MCLPSCVCFRGNPLHGRPPVLVPPGPEHMVGYCREWWEYKRRTRGLTGHPLPPRLEARRKLNRTTHPPGLWDLPRGGARGQTRPRAGQGRTSPLPPRGTKPRGGLYGSDSRVGCVCCHDPTLTELGFSNPKPRTWPLTRILARPACALHSTPGEGARRPLPVGEGAQRA